jgi:hypothetical protein
MKKKLLLFSITILLFACKKKDSTPEIIAPTNYEEIKMSNIQAKESTLTEINTTIISISVGNVWKDNDVFIFKTNENRFGKFQLLSMSASATNSFSIKATVYNTDGTEKSSTNLLNIRKTYLCNLDNMQEVLANAGGDFSITGDGGTPAFNLFFKPQAPAKFAKYTF